MFKLFITHPFGTFNVKHLRAFASLDAALDCAFEHIAEIVSDCSVWIETESEVLVLMEGGAA